MNKIVLTGNITKDLEIKKSGDIDVLKFSIAVKRDKDNADFIPITVFGKQAQAIQKYCRKGSKVLVSGALRISTYEDKNKVKRIAVEVIADSYGGVEFLGAAKKSDVDESLFVNE